MNFWKCLIFINFTGFVLAQGSAVNTLTIRNSIDKSKSFKIRKISKIRLSSDGPKVILIETFGPEKCAIPLNKITETPRPNYAGCTHCIDSDTEVENSYTQMFLNRREPNITCDILEGETVGFSFIGGTTINGESSFMSKSMTFDFAQYTDGPFTPKVEKESTLDRVLNNVEDILLKIAF